jgi:Mrp family chromosome partitioning ATPase/uncharacterized protein involved in exopolysaccharide biosynthesis
MRNHLSVTPPAEPELESPANAGEETAPLSSIPIRRFLRFVLRYWWVPLGTLALALVAAGTCVWPGPPTYVSTGVMSETGQLGRADMASGQAGRSFLGADTELLKSPAMLAKAREILRFAGTNGPVAASAAAAFRVNVRVTRVSRTALVEVAATGPEPACTQAFLEALMNECVASTGNVRNGIAGGAQASISREVNGPETEMQDKERALGLFKRANDPVVLEEEARGAGSLLATLKNRLLEYELERKSLEATVLERSVSEAAFTNQAMGLSDYVNGIMAGDPSVMPAEGLTASHDLEMLKAERERLGRNLRPKHPKMVNLNAQIERLDKLAAVFRRQNEEQMAALQKSIQMKIDDVEASIKECEARVTLAGSRLAEAEKLRQEAETARKVYDQARSALTGAGTGGNGRQETLQILEHAGPAIHSWRREVLALGLAAMAGLAAGLGIVFVVAIRDDRFYSLQEVKGQLRERVIGQVPEVSDTGGDGHVPLLEMEDPRQTYAESYRDLRSALLLLTPAQGERIRLLLIASATQEEGKSTIAANLAQTLAMDGSRVLLIDADLRRGSLHETLGMERLPGLAEVLCHPTLLAKAIQPPTARRRGGPQPDQTSGPENSAQPELIPSPWLPNLSLLARGGDVDNPGDLLLSPALDEVLARLRKRFDYVLIDSRPVFTADDVAAVAPKVDGTLLVVRSRYSRLAQVRSALELLYQRRAKVLGIVFNRARVELDSAAAGDAGGKAHELPVNSQCNN